MSNIVCEVDGHVWRMPGKSGVQRCSRCGEEYASVVDRHKRERRAAFGAAFGAVTGVPTPVPNVTSHEFHAMTGAERDAWLEARYNYRRERMAAYDAASPHIKRLHDVTIAEYKAMTDEERSEWHAKTKALRMARNEKRNLKLVAEEPANVSRPVLFPEHEPAQTDTGECYRLLTLARVKNERLEADNVSLAKSVRHYREQERKAWNRAFNYQLLAFSVLAVWAIMFTVAAVFFHAVPR